MKDISEVQPGDTVVDHDGSLWSVDSISTNKIFIEDMEYDQATGECGFRVGEFIRVPNSIDDIKRAEKHQRVSELNRTEWSNFNIEKLDRILAEAKR